MTNDPEYNSPCLAYCQQMSSPDYCPYRSDSDRQTIGSEDADYQTDLNPAAVGYTDQTGLYGSNDEYETYKCEYATEEWSNSDKYVPEYQQVDTEYDDIESLQQYYVILDDGKSNDVSQASQPTSCLGALLNPHQFLFGWRSKHPWACETTLRTWSRVMSAKMGVQFSVATSGRSSTKFLRRALSEYCARAPCSITAHELLPNDFLSNIQAAFDMAEHKPARRKSIIGVNCFPINMSVSRRVWKDLSVLSSITAQPKKNPKDLNLVSSDAAADRIGQLQRVIVSYYSKKFSIPEHSLTAFVADTGRNFRNMHTSAFSLKALSALAKRGQSVLLPKPHHPTLTAWFNVFQYSTGVTPRHYRRDHERSWLLDFGDIQQKLDDATAAVFLSNPSVMCGGVSSYRELDILLKMLEERNIPLIVEENFDYLVHDQQQQVHSVLEFKPKIPVIVINSSYRWMMFGAPGPCLAWALVYDPQSRLDQGLFDALRTQQQQSIKHPSCLAPPSALSSLLHHSGWANDIVRYIARNASIASSILGDTPGLRVTPPKAGYFLVVLINLDAFEGKFSSDVDFVSALFNQESVKVVCGSLLVGWKDCFALEMYMRRDLLIEACERIDEFCRRYAKNSQTN